jgi:hypothetical protein
MKRSHSIKSKELSRLSPSSNDDIASIFGGEVQDASEVGKKSRDKKFAHNTCEWSDGLEQYDRVDSFDDFTPRVFLSYVRGKISKRYKLSIGGGMHYIYTVLSHLRESLADKFPKENQNSLSVEYFHWYIETVADKDILSLKSREYWPIKFLLKPSHLAAFFLSRSSEKPLVRKVVVLSTDESTLTDMINGDLDNFVDSYGPIWPFALLRKKSKLLEVQASKAVIGSVKRIVLNGRASYTYLECLLEAYGPYPHAVEAMGARVFVDSMSEETRYDFSKALKFRPGDDKN